MASLLFVFVVFAVKLRFASMTRMALVLACLCALCLGSALITGKKGLRTIDARAGAAIAIPAATVLFMITSLFVLNTSNLTWAAFATFTALGLIYPGATTLITFESNDRLGPTITSTVAGTAPLFAVLSAAMLLGEKVTLRVALAAIGVAAGVATISWVPKAARVRRSHWALLLPLSGAMVRGLAQTLAKIGLVLCPNPFAAGVIGYMVSSMTVVAVNRIRTTKPARTDTSAVLWFVLTGVLNGLAVLCLYTALSLAPVTQIAPVVATFPLVTAVLGSLCREEPFTWRVGIGASVTVGTIVLLVA